jgi:hypothetical protein
MTKRQEGIDQLVSFCLRSRLTLNQAITSVGMHIRKKLFIKMELNSSGVVLLAIYMLMHSSRISRISVTITTIF